VTAADAHGRRAEVMAAFLEGHRKAIFSPNWFQNDREAWLASDAYARLAYGVFPPCPHCGSQLINPHSGNPPSCLKCRRPRAMMTDQTKSRPLLAMEQMRLTEILARPLMTPDDGGDQSWTHG
jgi:hypothetical protein